ncbi:MAG: hypothetical protein WCW52_03335 [Elusimicrobiales bacterium]|jgi:phenylacetate-coenzyme A ligase PaaK-like adenylate-forming protein
MSELFPNSEAVSRVRDPHIWSPEKERLFVLACRELAVFHAAHSPETAAIYRRRGFDPGSIRSMDDVARLPMIGVAAMKRYLLTSLPHERAALKLTSSGTRGQKTRIWLDEAGLARVQAMLAAQWEQEGLVSGKPANYITFSYDPADANDLGIAFTSRNQQRFAPAAGNFYALRKDPSGEWRFLREEARRTLEEYAAQGLPVRIFGIPSFIHDFLERAEKPLRLPPGSWMLTGGGWKAAEDKKVSRDFFRRRAAEAFGLELENIRDGYGMAEHCAPYLECRRHRFHVPAFARVLARAPADLSVLPPGRAGLLELISPYNAMMPNLAILSTDNGFIDPEPCPCGYNSPTFTLLGRAGLVKHKGCAIAAAEILKRT